MQLEHFNASLEPSQKRSGYAMMRYSQRMKTLLGNDFENTLLEANDRVYDVQSYPEADFKAMGNSANPQTIYSPNVND